MPYNQLTYRTPEGYDVIRHEYTDDNGKWHRLEGPAVICGNTQAWYNHGLLHRSIIDGPAIICDDYQAYWVHGKQVRVIFPNGKIYEP